MTKNSILWISILRITACLAVFMHHYLKTINAISNYSYSVILAIAIFIFISGYLAKINKFLSIKYFFLRILKIYIPYLIVICPVIALNAIIGAKDMNLKNTIYEILGGTLFVENPFYEAMWFVTFIFGLYGVVFLSCCFRKYFLTVMPFFLLVYFLIIINSTHIYFINYNNSFFWLISYYAGVFFGNADIPNVNRERNAFENLQAMSGVLMEASKHSLYFYLLHGPILFFLYKNLRLDKEFTFSIGLLLTAICSICLSNITKIIETRLGIAAISSAKPGT